MSDCSGKFVIRMSRALHRRLKEEAAANGLSLNQWCVNLLQGPRQTVPVAVRHTGKELLPPPLQKQLIERWGKDLIGLVLFGSAARGEATRESDLDLLLVFARNAALSRGLYSEWDELWEKTRPLRGVEISPQFVRLPEDPMEAGGLWYEVAIDGVVLWEQSLQISRFLCRIREAVSRGDIVRSSVHGSHYWIKRVAEAYEK